MLPSETAALILNLHMDCHVLRVYSIYDNTNTLTWIIGYDAKGMFSIPTQTEFHKGESQLSYVPVRLGTLRYKHHPC